MHHVWRIMQHYSFVSQNHEIRHIPNMDVAICNIHER